MPLSIDVIGESMNLTIQQGAPLKTVIAEMVNPDGTPVDLTGCIIRAHIKKNAADRLAICQFTTAVIDPPNGIYAFGLSAESTELLKAGDNVRHPASKYVWDMFLIDSLGDPHPLYHGDIYVLRRVTDG